MSKKKSVTTMRLKDFHGGSIPSDLPLPSAPGLPAKPSQERPATMPGRSERTRHVSSSSPSAISPLPLPPRVIGRHFDEDERTPFDAPALQARAPAAAVPVATGAWAQRKEQSSSATMGLSPAGSNTGVATAWSPSRVAQASALEKVISGRWHSSSRSDQLVPPPVVDSESRPISEDSYVTSGNVLPESRIRSPVGQNHRVLSAPEQTGVIGENRVRSAIDELQGFGMNNNRRQKYNNWEERPRSVGLGERKDRAGLVAVGYEVKEIERPASHEGRSVADRPRLKLLPRSKPVESQEMIRVTEEKVGFELSSSSAKLPVRNNNDIHEMNGNETAKASKEGNTLEDERPRLNLKPRSQAVGCQTEETGAKERPSVFGGARPRELVLKDRGVDLAPDDEIDNNLVSNRPNSSSAKPDPKPEPIIITPAKPIGNRAETYPLQQQQQRNIRMSSHTNHHHHHHPQPSTWRDDANNRKVAAHQQQTRPEPDSWRKPEPAKREDVGGSRPGKGASALELAEAFSKRVTTTDVNRETVSRNPNNPTVFSRLLGNEREIYKGSSSPHQQINGY